MSVDKKIRKKLHLERIKRQQIMVQHAEQHKEAQQKQRDDEAALKASMQSSAPVDAAGDVVWSAKMQEISNRLTGRKRAALSRYGRYAATSDAGGMGR